MADAALFVTTKGYGKVVDSAREEFPPKGRGGKGVISFKVTEDSGPVACVEHVRTGIGERVMITTARGQSLMIEVDDIKPRSRTAGGIKLMNVADGDEVVNVLV